MSELSRLVTFLQQRRCKQGEKCTHTGLYIPAKGSFHIQDSEHIDQFWTLYNDAYYASLQLGYKLPLGITETHEELSPILVDIDINNTIAFGMERKYTMYDVQMIVQQYFRVIQKYIINPELCAHIFQKQSPRMHPKKNDIVKDGVHIMFKDIIVNKQIHKRIHNDVKNWIVENESKFMHITENPSSLIDDSVVAGNWFIYGSSKEDDTSAYTCTHVMDTDACLPFTMTAIPQMFSIKGHTKQSNCNILNDNQTHHVVQDTFENNCHQDELKHLVSMLNISRCEDEPLWIRIGWCLHNIDPNSLQLWIDWSKQSDKFEEGVCERKWKKFRDTGYNIKSLYQWAKNDSPVVFEEFINQMVKVKIEYSIGCGAHYDIACIMHAKYHHMFCCANPKRMDEWYEFKDHRWQEMPGGYLLMNIMSKELAPQFTELANRYKHGLLHADVRVVKENKDKMDKCLKLAYQVKDNSFKTGILKECSRMFFDPLFDKHKDNDCNLIGFNNGVFDINTLSFRDGAPDDYITKTTGNNFVEYSWNDPIVKDIYHFLQKIQPNENMLNYLLMVLSSFLGGSTEDQTFQIWTGSGSNGKTTILELFEKSFGEEYTGKFPVTLLTKERASSGAATPELHDVMKKRLASMQEPNDNDVIYTGAMKEYTGGDKIYSRGLFSNPTPFKPQFKLVLLCNKMPTIKGWDYGTWRRIRVLHFSSSFVDNPNPNNSSEFAKDRKLNNKFDEWKEAFMWILIDKLKEYKKHGIKEPTQVMQASKDYKKKSDMYEQFLDDTFFITENETDRMSIAELYDAFRCWWRSSMSGTLPNKNDLMDYVQANTKIKRVNRNNLGCIRPKSQENA